MLSRHRRIRKYQSLMTTSKALGKLWWDQVDHWIRLKLQTSECLSVTFQTSILDMLFHKKKNALTGKKRIGRVHTGDCKWSHSGRDMANPSWLKFEGKFTKFELRGQGKRICRKDLVIRTSKRALRLQILNSWLNFDCWRQQSAKKFTGFWFSCEEARSRSEPTWFDQVDNS